VRTGNVLIGLGILLVVAGVAARFGLLSWFGRLPGDVRVDGESSSFFAPLTSMILLSVVGSILLNLLLRLFRD
jgi:Protein of unknown function (DUF2905)